MIRRVAPRATIATAATKFTRKVRNPINKISMAALLDIFALLIRGLSSSTISPTDNLLIYFVKTNIYIKC